MGDRQDITHPHREGEVSSVPISNGPETRYRQREIKPSEERSRPNSSSNDVSGKELQPTTEMARSPCVVFYSGLYAPSGFDMMSILIRVATRPNPKYDLGAIDSNCALVLCDTFAPDTPIVYCSEPFEVLTGYRSDEIMGRNCRFLQSRYGYAPRTTSAGSNEQLIVTETGWERPVMDELSERHLRELRILLARKEEAQVTLTNFRKGGEPFINILTTIPVRWGSDSDQLRYVVGFQADANHCFSGQ